MDFHKHGPMAMAIATVVALAGLAAYSAPAVATQPSTASAPLVWSTFAPMPAAPMPTAIPAPAGLSRFVIEGMIPELAALRTTAAPPAGLSRSVIETMIPELAAPRPAAAPAATPKPTPKPTPRPTAKPAAPKPPATVAVNASLRAKIVAIALAQRGKRYVAGGSGPSTFDCSGLVQYAYRVAGVSSRLGGGHSALGIYLWGRSHGLTSRSNPRVGDVVVYGGGSHVAIYIGNGRVVSALNPAQGIRVTGLYALGAGFTTFVHTRV